MNTQFNDVNVRTPFVLPDMVEGDFTSDELSEDMDGLQLGFQRAKIPGGGVTQFELPGDDPEHPRYVECLEGVIVYNHYSNAYWPEGSEYDDNTPPLCQAVFGEVGYGEPGGLCVDCMLNQFGSVSKGNGKACKNMRVLYLLQSGEFVPLQLSLPPTSIKPFKDFVSGLMARRRAVFGSVVRIGLKKETSNGFTYSVATFQRLYDFSGEELNSIRAYANGFREQAKAMLHQRAELNKAAADNAIEMDSTPLQLPDNDTHFAAGVIDGERERLPA